MIVLADVVFYHFGFEKCYSKVNDNNRLGLKSALSFGFTAEGKLRKSTPLLTGVISTNGF